MEVEEEESAPAKKRSVDIEMKKQRREEFRKHKLAHIKHVTQVKESVQDKKLAKIKNKHRKNMLAKARC
ncbi:hypothetical protein Ciccas_013109 [Cichlidogyrus casuarinus]|uniref:Uncharacterized protein n=1 Tax=Cichlidogyrus casuarinus TaxID=1844966 RepID=A0ABD2PN98_9PLAT